MKNKSAFALIELLIAIALIALLMSVVVPTTQNLMPRYEREQFITRFNALIQLAWRNAIVTHRLHRVVINLEDRRMYVEIAADHIDMKKEPVFKALERQSTRTAIRIPETIDIKQCIIEGFDELSRFAGRKTAETWFYIIPEGLAQEIIINFVDLKDRVDGRPKQFGLVLNPFTAQVSVHDAFQK